MAALRHTNSTDILFPEPGECSQSFGDESFFSTRSHVTVAGYSPSARAKANSHGPGSRYLQVPPNGYSARSDNYAEVSRLNKSFEDDLSRMNGSFEEENRTNSFGKREGSKRSYIAQIKDNISKYVNPSVDNFKKLTRDKNANVRPRSTPKARDRLSGQWNCQSLIPPPIPPQRKENQRNSYGGQTSFTTLSVAVNDNIGRNRNSIDSGFLYSRQDSFAQARDQNNDGMRRKLPPPPTQPQIHIQKCNSFNSGTYSNGGQDETETVEELYTIPHTFAHQVVRRQKQPPPPPPPKPRQQIDATPKRPKSDAALIDDLRRRTWSPPAFSRAMGNGGSFSVIRSYHSNDALDDVTGDCLYEDLDRCSSGAAGPPKIAPVSGKLEQNAHKSLIKPIAFKPVLTPQSRYAPSSHRAQLSPHPPPNETPPRIQTYGTNMRSTMSNATLSPDTPPDSRSFDAHVTSPRVTFDPIKSTNQMSPDDGYVSQEYHSGSHSHSNSNTSHNGSMHGSHNGSVHNDSDRSMDRSMDQSMGYMSNSLPRPSDRPESFNSSNVSRLSQRGDSYIQTPSPSDSGVGELEAMLRDKDATIQHLRDTMERNETAILQVCAEKEQNWEMELREVHQEWERRWRHHQEKAFKMEQALLLQLFKLQQERKTLKLDVESARSEKEKSDAQCSDCEKDLKQCKTKLEEVSWELAQKSGEIALLKSQLKDSKELASHKGNDIVSIKTALKGAQHSCDEKDHEILTLEAQMKSLKEQLTNKNNEITALQRSAVSANQELAGLRKDLHTAKQQVDLKELQMEMKCKELERLQFEHNSCMKSSLKGNPVGAIVNGVTSAPAAVASAQPPDGASSKDVDKTKQELESLKKEFNRERDQWLDEKNKVIRYQKHLQLNYVQMYRKNKVLEAEVEQLTLELEKRDVCLMEPVKETEESVC